MNQLLRVIRQVAPEIDTQARNRARDIAVARGNDKVLAILDQYKSDLNWTAKWF